MIEVDENEENVDIKEDLDDIDKQIDESGGARLKYSIKGSQPLTFRMNVIQLDVIDVETEAKVDEPFQEHVKHVEVKTFDDVSTEVKKEMNVDVIGYQLFKQVNLQ